MMATGENSKWLILLERSYFTKYNPSLRIETDDKVTYMLTY